MKWRSILRLANHITQSPPLFQCPLLVHFRHVTRRRLPTQLSLQRSDDRQECLVDRFLLLGWSLRLEFIVHLGKPIRSAQSFTKYRRRERHTIHEAVGTRGKKHAEIIFYHVVKGSFGIDLVFSVVQIKFRFWQSS